MSVHMRLMSIERYVGLAVAVAVVVDPGSALEPRLASAQTRALPDPGQRGYRDRACSRRRWLASSLPYTGASIKLQSAERLAFGVVPIAYLVGLFRARMGRVGVSDLIVELGRGLEPGRLRDAIARSLRDPSLEVGYWIRDPDEYVDVDGQPCFCRSDRRACGDDPRASRPQGRRARPRPGAERGPGTARRRLERSRARARERAPARGAARAARRGAGTRAPGSSKQASPSGGASNGTCTTAPSSVSSPSPSTCGWPRRRCTTTRSRPRRCSTGVGDDLKQALEELRELARGLHPAVLTDRGLAPALQSLANRSPFPVRSPVFPADRLPEAGRSGPLLRRRGKPHQRREALRRDRRAASSCRRHPRLVVVEIRDNGSGGASLTERHRASRTRRPRRGPRRRAPRSEPPRAPERSSGQSCRCAERVERDSRSPPDRQVDAGEGARRSGEQRLLLAAQESVEEGEQIGTLGRECRRRRRRSRPEL